MNKHQFYTLTGALLATTALTGAASAATVIRYTAATNVTASTASRSIANTIFSTTAATANAVILSDRNADIPALSFVNNLPNTTKFSMQIPITGATFDGNQIPQNKLLFRNSATGSWVGSITACGATQVIGGNILIANCSVGTTTASAAVGFLTNVFVGGIALSGVGYTQASGLATASSGVIQLSGGQIYDANTTSIIFETITAGTLVASGAPVTASVTAGTSTVTDATTTPAAFKFLAGGGVTMTLASIQITGTGVFGTDLATAVSPDGNAYLAVTSAMFITVTSGLFSSGAVASVNLVGGKQTVTTTATTSLFTGGSVTFAIVRGAVASQQYSGSVSIGVTFNGTNAIPATVAGSVAVSFATAPLDAGVQGISAVNGSTAAVSSGGFSAELNSFNASQNSPFASYIRIHNNGNAAGTVAITLRTDTSGTVLGSYTTAAIPQNATLQLSAAEIETGAGVSPSVGLYTVSVSGAIIGYVQHIIYNPANGQAADLSGFRNGTATQEP